MLLVRFPVNNKLLAKFWGSQIFGSVGVSAPNPHIVQGPTVFMYPDPKKYYILYGL